MNSGSGLTVLGYLILGTLLIGVAAGWLIRRWGPPK